MSPLSIARLLQNPLGDDAPLGEQGDIVRISDGSKTIYLTPGEYDRATDDELRFLLAADGSTPTSHRPSAG